MRNISKTLQKLGFQIWIDVEKLNEQGGIVEEST